MTDKPQGYYPSTERDVPPPATPPQQDRTGLWIGLSAGLVLLCLCACALLLGGYYVTASSETANGDPLIALGLITLTPTPTDTPTPTSTPTPTPTPTATPTPTPDPVEYAAQFEGIWVNEDTSSDQWARLEIHVRGSEIAVHLWGVCEPGTCDAGEVATPITDALDSKLELTWNHGFAMREQTITLLPNGALRVVMDTHFTDDSGRDDYTSNEVFIRE